MTDKFDLLDFITKFEAGEIELRELFDGFGWLIKTGTAWTLQGTYGRTASSFIDAGLIGLDGTVDWDAVDIAISEGL